MVEEVDLEDFESKIRREVQKDKQREIDVAVNRAIDEDRRKRGSSRQRAPAPSESCPACPKCEGSGDFDESMCSAICDARIESCSIDEYSRVIRLLLWLESFFPAKIAEVTLILGGLAVGLLLLRGIGTLFAPPSDTRANRYMYEEREERALQDGVRYYSAQDNGSHAAPPSASRSVGGMNDVFSPRQMHASPAPINGGAHHAEEDFADSIYQSPQTITPSKRGGGVRRRTPYSQGERY